MPAFPFHPPPYHYLPISPLPSTDPTSHGNRTGIVYVPILGSGEEERDEKTMLMEAEMEAEMLEHAVTRRSGGVDKMQLDSDEGDDSFWDQFEDRDDSDSGSSSDSGSEDTLSDGTVRHRSRSSSPLPSSDCPTIRIRPATPSPSEAEDDDIFFPRSRNVPVVDRHLLSPTWSRTFPEAFIPPRTTRRKRPKPPTGSEMHPKLPPIKLRIPASSNNHRRASAPACPYNAHYTAPQSLPPPLEKTWSSAILPGMECWSPSHGGGGGGWPECWSGSGNGESVRVRALGGGWEEKENVKGRERLPSMRVD